MITYQKVKRTNKNHLCNQCENRAASVCVEQIVEFDDNGIVVNCSYFPPEFNKITERDINPYPINPKATKLSQKHPK